jgi:hypothetical protein
MAGRVAGSESRTPIKLSAAPETTTIAYVAG